MGCEKETTLDESFSENLLQNQTIEIKENTNSENIVGGTTQSNVYAFIDATLAVKYQDDFYSYFDHRIFDANSGLTDEEKYSLVAEGYQNIRNVYPDFDIAYENLDVNNLNTELFEQYVNEYFNANQEGKGDPLIPNETACLNSLEIFADCGFFCPPCCLAAVGIKVHC